MTRCVVGLLCSLSVASCGQSAAAGSGSGSGSTATPAITDDGPCHSDSDCVLADTTCGNCGCPTHPLTKVALAAHDERCRGRHVRCVVPQCPPVSERAACVSDRCVSVPAPTPPPSAGDSLAETRCESSADCTSVPTDCCPCDIGDWAPANRASSAAVTARLAPTGCGPCPQQDCPPFDRVCTDGRCELRGR